MRALLRHRGETLHPLMRSRLLAQGHARETPCCRRPTDMSFTSPDLELASTLAGFLSASIARVSTDADRGGSKNVACRLASREIEVARLAASELDNQTTAELLGITRETVKQTLRRVYKKLNVSGRAQMAVLLALRGMLEG